MAYQTLPNTFVSGSTIYSTAVSANFVAVLQGYTTGSYDLWGRNLEAKEVTVNSAGGTRAGYIGSAGTAEFAGACTITGTLTANGSVSVAGSAAVTGDLYTVANTNYTPTLSGWTSTLCSGTYRQIGKLVYCQIFGRGKPPADTSGTLLLPVTASTYQLSNNQYLGACYSASVGVSPAIGVIVPNSTSMLIYNAGATSFISSTSYDVMFNVVYTRE